MRFCTRCGRYGADADTQCQHCGADLAASGLAAQRDVGRVRLIRFIGVMFIVGGVPIPLIAGFVDFILSNIGSFGTHQGVSQNPLPLQFDLEIAEASIVTVVMIVVGVGLIRLKPWARIGAILVGALGLYFSIASFTTVLEMYGMSALPGPPVWMILVAAAFPPITLIVASLAFLLIVVLHSRGARAAFVSGRRKE